MLSQAITGAIYIASAFTVIGLISLPLGYFCYQHFEGYRHEKSN